MKIENINFDKIKKGVKTGTLVLVTSASIGVAAMGGVIGLTNIIENKTEEALMQATENKAYGIVDAAKLAYIEGLLTDKPITSGDVTDLEVTGTSATAGTWSTIDMDNDGDPEIQLKGVEIDGYVINSAGTTDEYDLDIKKR